MTKNFHLSEFALQHCLLNFPCCFRFEGNTPANIFFDTVTQWLFSLCTYQNVNILCTVLFSKQGYFLAGQIWKAFIYSSLKLQMDVPDWQAIVLQGMILEPRLFPSLPLSSSKLSSQGQHAQLHQRSSRTMHGLWPGALHIRFNYILLTRAQSHEHTYLQEGLGKM